MRKPTGWRAIFSAKIPKKQHGIKDNGVFGKARALCLRLSWIHHCDSSTIRAKLVQLAACGFLDPGRGVNADLFRTGCHLPLNCSSKLHEYVQN